jgi:diguanylate cyclase (GGDEF)-like protein/PAS domain S-box-containing protein
MADKEPSYEELQERLREAEAIVEEMGRAESADAGDARAGASGESWRDTERALRAIMQLMSEGACVLDEAGTVIHCNAQLGAILRCPPAELTGKSFGSFIHPQDLQTWEAAFGGRHQPAALGFMLNVVSPAGGTVPVHVAVCALDQLPTRIAFLVASDLAWQERRVRQLERTNEELERERDALEVAATTDSTTGAYTAGALSEVLATELACGRRYGYPVSLLMADLDHFKELNDSYGHAFGDVVLREFCDRCRDAIRSTDYLVRYGGDEFVIILPQTGAPGALAVGNRILNSVRGTHFGREQRAVPLTVSVGLATASPSDELGGSELMEQADRAMYTVKDRGRNGIAHWDDQAE